MLKADCWADSKVELMAVRMVDSKVEMMDMKMVGMLVDLKVE